MLLVERRSQCKPQKPLRTYLFLLAESLWTFYTDIVEFTTVLWLIYDKILDYFWISCFKGIETMNIRPLGWKTYKIMHILTFLTYWWCPPGSKFCTHITAWFWWISKYLGNLKIQFWPAGIRKSSPIKNAIVKDSSIFSLFNSQHTEYFLRSYIPPRLSSLHLHFRQLHNVLSGFY